MKTKLIIALLFIATLSYGQMIPEDKILHAEAGVAIVMMSHIVTKGLFKQDINKSFWNDVKVVAIIGIGKELKDMTQPNNYFDPIDAGFTIAAGIITALVIKKLHKSKRKYLF